MDPGALVDKYKSKGLLIDTNLLVLLTVGIYRPDRIATFKRTRPYSSRDFEFIVRLADTFNRRITTPNILTEADNLLRQLPEVEHPNVAATLGVLVREAIEIYCISADIVSNVQFARIGLTDCVTISCSADVLVVTDDYRLSNMLSHLGRDSINIDYIRALY
jgi:hypothetical protein